MLAGRQQEKGHNKTGQTGEEGWLHGGKRAGFTKDWQRPQYKQLYIL